MVEKYDLEIDSLRHPRLVAKESVEYELSRANDPEKVTDMLNTCFRLKDLAEEHMYMVCFSTSFEPLGVFEISHGTVRDAVCGIREIFLRAALCGAVFIIIAHNHPSGDLTPSDADIKVANKLKEFGGMMEIPMKDFIIISSEGFLSFSREGRV